MEYYNNIVRKASMARNGAFYMEQALQGEINRIHCYSTWILLRDTTFHQILVGNIHQTDSTIITSVTLSNNISRRSMEFVVNPVSQYTYTQYMYYDSDDEADSNNYNRYPDDDHDADHYGDNHDSDYDNDYNTTDGRDEDDTFTTDI